MNGRILSSVPAPTAGNTEGFQQFTYQSMFPLPRPGYPFPNLFGSVNNNYRTIPLPLTVTAASAPRLGEPRTSQTFGPFPIPSPYFPVSRPTTVQETPAQVGGAEAGASASSDGPSVSLTDQELWRSFCTAGNEMIVTKPGR